MSTFYEGLPTVLIEALYVGTTPVATDAPGGIREILEDGRYGYIVPMQDAQALSEGMLKVILGGMFSMTMLVTLDPEVADFNTVQERLEKTAENLGVQITIQREDVFQYMYKI